MPIQFHCEHCGAKISAPDAAGGKKGRCPSCKQHVYVPAPDADELDLAPLDEKEEKKLADKVARDLAAEHDLFLAQAGSQPADEADPSLVDDPHGEGGVALPAASPGGAKPAPPRELLIAYLVHMAKGNLEQANAVAGQLKADRPAAMQAIALLTADPVPEPRIAKLPLPVMAGFLKQLEHQLK
ncbi:MAG: hypothetical protein BIFFINMI_03320 [Phycisphaerae bacterium]|nr:hypothetical protein [Phycisphaerae bacterium]